MLTVEHKHWGIRTYESVSLQQIEEIGSLLTFAYIFIITTSNTDQKVEHHINSCNLIKDVERLSTSKIIPLRASEWIGTTFPTRN